MSPKTAPPASPQEPELRQRLGLAYALYRELLESGPFTPVWKYYGLKSGWTLKLLEKKRNLCFVQPRDGYFEVSLLLGDAAVETALAGPSRDSIKEALRAARRYAEGRGVRVPVAAEADLAEVRMLLQVKRQKR